MDGTFCLVSVYAAKGRASIPPDRLLGASPLRILYSIHSERALVERLDFDLLFRWFVERGMEDPVWDRTLAFAVGATPKPTSTIRAAPTRRTNRRRIRRRTRTRRTALPNQAGLHDTCADGKPAWPHHH